MPKEFINKFLQNKRKNSFFLIIILLIAFILRFWQLGSIPMSLNWDEAAWGYNAYSIGREGRDEFGVSYPYKYIESFGDFKPPVYAYLASIPVKFLGLNEFATRSPSALFGFLTVLLTYFFHKQNNAGVLLLLSGTKPAACKKHQSPRRNQQEKVCQNLPCAGAYRCNSSISPVIFFFSFSQESSDEAFTALAFHN